MQSEQQRSLKLKSAQMFEQAQAAFQKQQYDVALPLFETILEKNPSDGPALFFKKWIKDGPIAFVK